MAIYLIGSFEDENNNKYETELNGNLLNHMFEEQIFNFSIYEKDLTFVFIKIFRTDRADIFRCDRAVCLRQRAGQSLANRLRGFDYDRS